jgi:hypothetical protein
MQHAPDTFEVAGTEGCEESQHQGIVGLASTLIAASSSARYHEADRGSSGP